MDQHTDDTPAPARRPRTRWAITGLAAVVVVLAVVVVVLLVRSPSTPPGAAPSPASSTTTSATADTSSPATTTDPAPNRAAVDQAVAMDGVPVDWSQTGGDAYDFVSHVCNFVAVYPGGVDAVNWKTIPIPGVMTVGGMRALVAGVPIQCAQDQGVIDVVYQSFFGNG